MNNYNLKLIKEFKIGEYYIPFLFSLDKIKAFPEQTPVYVGENDKYSPNFLESNIKTKLFECFMANEFQLVLDEDLDCDMLNSYEEGCDYKIENDRVFILSKELFYDFLHWIPEFEVYHIAQIFEFKDSCYSELISAFINNVTEDLEYYLDNKMDRTNSMHMFQWALGETSTNSNPFFPENLNKATIDWSWREVELRNLYKSKVFKVENAIQKEKNRLEEEALKNTKKR